jgi:murein DD-endopeptidase MepM/ murein hydrolase activator NlpD
VKRGHLQQVNLKPGILFVLALCALAACRLGLPPGDLPTPVPWQTPEPADAFDFPLDPARFGVYIPHRSGPLLVDTRFGAQNPGLGKSGKCFVDANGDKVPFEQLYHAGEDWFALDERGQVDGFGARGTLVRAVANGVVTWQESLGSEGYALVIEHVLPDDQHVWSAYWHLAALRVARGEAVQRGQVIGQVHDRSYNSHLHWEIRTFGDGRQLFPANSAGGRGTCNGHVAGVGYTWDDDPQQAGPQAWGYLPPSEFVQARR